MKVGDIVGGRFEITEVAKGARPRGVDRETGLRVIVPDVYRLFFLDVVAMRGMAELVRVLDDPRLTRVLSIDPLVLEEPPEQAPLTDREWIDAAIELLDVLCSLQREGVHASPWEASALRGPQGIEVRVAAPSEPGLHFFANDRMAIDHQLRWWLRDRIGSQALADAIAALSTTSPAALRDGLAPLASHRGAARAKEIEAPSHDEPLPSTTIDFDRAVALGEEMLGGVDRLWGRDYVVFGLAAAYHHRGCVAWQRGEPDRALADLDRAIELDPHARYLTTRALCAEALGDLELAGSLHDRAVRAIGKPSVIDPDGARILLLEAGTDPLRRIARDAARTHHARGALRARRGDFEGALADLEEAERRDPSERVTRALAVLRARAASGA